MMGLIFMGVNSKSTGLFPPGAALGAKGVFSTLLCEIRSRHPRNLKFTELIVYIMFYKICKFESLTVKYQSIPSLTIPRGDPRDFAHFNCPRGRVFVSLSCLGGLKLKLKVQKFGKKRDFSFVS